MSSAAVVKSQPVQLSAWWRAHGRGSQGQQPRWPYLAIADLLRGDYKQSEYGRVILPLVVLCRLDCFLESTKREVLARLAGPLVECPLECA